MSELKIQFLQHQSPRTLIYHEWSIYHWQSFFLAQTFLLERRMQLQSLLSFFFFLRSFYVCFALLLATLGVIVSAYVIFFFLQLLPAHREWLCQLPKLTVILDVWLASVASLSFSFFFSFLLLVTKCELRTRKKRCSLGSRNGFWQSRVERKREGESQVSSLFSHWRSV